MKSPWKEPRKKDLIYTVKIDVSLPEIYIFKYQNIYYLCVPFIKTTAMNLLKYAEQQLIAKTNVPAFRAGDSVTVNYKIKEGDKERVQQFTGVVIQIHGDGNVKTFTVRKISNGVGVERIFPLYSPFIESIEVEKKGEVRRAKLFYLRAAIGKKAKIDELKDEIENGLSAEPELPASSNTTSEKKGKASAGKPELVEK